jgi:hypothetical protein
MWSRCGVSHCWLIPIHAPYMLYTCSYMHTLYCQHLWYHTVARHECILYDTAIMPAICCIQERIVDSTSLNAHHTAAEHYRLWCIIPERAHIYLYVHTQCNHSAMRVLLWLRVESDVTCQILPRLTHMCQLHYLVCLLFVCLLLQCICTHTMYTLIVWCLCITILRLLIASSAFSVHGLTSTVHVYISFFHLLWLLHHTAQRGTVATVYKPQQDIQAETFKLYMSKTKGLCSRLTRCT